MISPLSKTLRLTLLLICISLLFWSLEKKQALLFIHRPVTVALLPLMRTSSRWHQGAASSFSIFSVSIGAVKREKALEYQNNKLLAENAYLVQLKAENDSLRQALNAQLKQYKPVIGKVYLVNNRILVQISDKVEVLTGAFVVQQRNVVGQIAAQRGNALYEVMPITSPTFIVKARAMHDGAAVDGLAQGQFSTSIHFSKVLASAAIAADDIVIIHDEEKPLANDLLLGKIQSVKRNETEVFQEAVVVPLFDLQKDPMVYILQ